MELLIQEFDSLYPNLRPNKKIRVGESDQTVIVQKEHRIEKNFTIFYIIEKIIINILFPIV